MKLTGEEARTMLEWDGPFPVAGLGSASAQLMQMSRRLTGWPLCPVCGEDELWSEDFLHWHSGPKPAYPPACGHDTFGCYQCGWEGRVTWLYPKEEA